MIHYGKQHEAIPSGFLFVCAAKSMNKSVRRIACGLEKIVEESFLFEKRRIVIFRVGVSMRWELKTFADEPSQRSWAAGYRVDDMLAKRLTNARDWWDTCWGIADRLYSLLFFCVTIVLLFGETTDDKIPTVHRFTRW